MTTALVLLGILVGFITGCACTVWFVAKNWALIMKRIEEKG